MSSLIIQSETLDDIADAIRAKTGKSASMTPLEMPQEIASISGGGGGWTETLLWTNPNTATARSSLNATLSDSLQNYRFIRITYAYNTSSAAASNSVIFPIFYESGNYMFPSGDGEQRMCIGLNNASGNPFVRQAYVADDTTIHFNNAYRVNTSGNTNTNLIPWYIHGINV